MAYYLMASLYNIFTKQKPALENGQASLLVYLSLSCEWFIQADLICKIILAIRELLADQ